VLEEAREAAMVERDESKKKFAALKLELDRVKAERDESVRVLKLTEEYVNALEQKVEHDCKLLDRVGGSWKLVRRRWAARREEPNQDVIDA